MYAGIVDWPWWAYVFVTLGLTHVTIASVTIHRKHHAKCETAEDPHSPQIYGINRVLWTGVFLYVKESRNADTLKRYGHGTPDDWIENHLYTPWQKLGVLLMLVIDVAVFGFAYGAMIWAAQMVWIPFWAAGVINGLGHFWGYRNFNTPDASTNIFPLGLLIGGEELHNNHHTYATSAKLSNKWYEVDLGWGYICILAALGLAKVKNVAPVPVVGKVRATIDFETLQAVIANRYEVLAGYAKSIGQLYREELAKTKNGKQFKGLKRWLAVDASAVPEDSRGRLSALQTSYTMRGELVALWARSNATREQLIKELQNWCHRAETSGVRQLQEFSLRLRSYSLA